MRENEAMFPEDKKCLDLRGPELSWQRNKQMDSELIGHSGTAWRWHQQSLCYIIHGPIKVHELSWHSMDVQQLIINCRKCPSSPKPDLPTWSLWCCWLGAEHESIMQWTFEFLCLLNLYTWCTHALDWYSIWIGGVTFWSRFGGKVRL